MIGGRGNAPGRRRVAGGLARPSPEPRRAGKRLAQVPCRWCWRALRGPHERSWPNGPRSSRCRKDELLGTVVDGGALDLTTVSCASMRAPERPTSSSRRRLDPLPRRKRSPRPPTPSRCYCRAPDGHRTSPTGSARWPGSTAPTGSTPRSPTPSSSASARSPVYPCHQTVMYHYARLVELLHAAEKPGRDRQRSRDPLATDVRDRTEHGAALGLGPRRGAARHADPRLRRRCERGSSPGANLIVATQQNIAAVNQTIALSAERYLARGDAALLNGIEFGIRCYDPCLSCATHRLGDMKLDSRRAPRRRQKCAGRSGGRPCPRSASRNTAAGAAACASTSARCRSSSRRAPPRSRASPTPSAASAACRASTPVRRSASKSTATSGCDPSTASRRAPSWCADSCRSSRSARRSPSADLEEAWSDVAARLFALSDTVVETIGKGYRAVARRAGVMSAEHLPEMYEATSLDEVLAALKKRFAHAFDFDYTIAGEQAEAPLRPVRPLPRGAQRWPDGRRRRSSARCSTSTGSG